LVVHVRIACDGIAEAGEKLLAGLRNVAPVILDTVGELTYAQAAAIHLDPPLPLAYADRSSGLAELTARTVDALVRFAGPRSDCRLASIEIRHLGGALDRDPRTPDAVPVRGLAYQLFAFGVGPEDQMPELRAQLAAMVDRVRPWADRRRMVSFLASDEASGRHAVREIYGAQLYDRLAEIKRDHDPANMFRINHNTEPARA
jgi:Berberine and berberine like